MHKIFIQSKKWYFSRLVSLPLVYFAIVLFFIFNIIDCSFKKPSAPSWDIEVTIPLINKVFTLAEIAEDESILSVDSTGLLALDFESDLDTYYVGDQLTMEQSQENFSSELGLFSISSPGSESISVELSEIFPEAELFDSLTVVIPPFSFATNRNTLNSYENFSYVVIDSGNVTLTVTNNLAVPLGPPLSLEIWDAFADTLVISTPSNAQVLPGQAANFSVSLRGKKIPNSLSILLAGGSPGSQGELVTVYKNSSFEVEAEISDLLVSEALAQVPSQTFSDSNNVTITDSLVLNEAVIEAGEIQLSIGGRLPLDARIFFELPDFRSLSGEALMDSVLISKNSTSNLSIILNDYRLRPQLADFGQQTIQFLWSIKTIDTGNQMVLVTSTDFVNADLSVSEIQFSSISGKIGAKEIEINQNDIEFDIPADLDSIFLETASLELYIYNGINFPAETDLKIEGRNELGDVVVLDVKGQIQAATQSNVPVTSLIELNQQNSNIKEFISILPNLLRVSGHVKLGDESWVGTVSKNDFINGKVKISAPLAFKLPPQTIESDVNEVDIDDGTKEDIENNLSSGRFFAEVKNHLPLGASVEFVFAQNDSSIYQNSILSIGPIAVDAASSDSSGFVNNPIVSEINLNLTEEDMRTFLKDSLYVGLRIRLDGTNDKFVRLHASDYVEVKSYGKVNLKINPQ